MILRTAPGDEVHLLYRAFSVTLSRRHHYHLREPVGNLTLIKTQSIAHYIISIDRRELEVCLSVHHTDFYTEPIIPPHIIIATVFSIPAC